MLNKITDGINIYRGDANNIIRRLDPESIDLVITSPPYAMGKSYENGKNIEKFIDLNKTIAPKIISVVKMGGSICWQTGYHVKNNNIMPLDYIVHDIFGQSKALYLRNRIIWKFGHGYHCQKRFSGRHEVVMWYTKGKKYYFNLDPVRVPQKYPGKKHYKGPNKGKFSGNPKGKNPTDIWEIPNVKAGHVEKTIHPCQFPISLARMLIRSLVPPEGLVLDPFMGTGSAGAAAIIEKRRFIGIEIDSVYFNIAEERLAKAVKGELKYREFDKPVYEPKGDESICVKPSHFKW